MKYIVAGLVLISLFACNARAQSMARYTLDSWQEKDIAATYDHPIVEAGGHVNNAPSDAQMFSWDSFGRVRINRKDQDAPFFAYRILTIDAGTDSRFLPSSMDDFELALGLHLGELDGWKLASVLGAGYSSTHPFVHASGVFGIGHVTAERQLDDQNALVLSADYEGNGGLLPDVPLPGFALVHHEAKADWMLGYPMSKLAWRPLERLEIMAGYTVPFTADLDVEYRLARHFGLYGDAGNFFQGFVQARNNGQPSGDITNRQFMQMRRVEMGVRVIFDPLVDASIGVGYAFDQGFSDGFDVRDLRPVSHISDEPYLAIVLRGRF